MLANTCHVGHTPGLQVRLSAPVARYAATPGCAQDYSYQTNQNTEFLINERDFAHGQTAPPQSEVLGLLVGFGSAFK